MNAKTVFSCALIWTVLGDWVVCAQQPALPPGQSGDAPILQLSYPASGSARGAAPSSTNLPLMPASAPAEATEPSVPSGPRSLSDWILYTRPDCCGPIGGNGPICAELYVRAGPSVPIEGATFGHVLETGWEVQGGGRSLFFNEAMDAACTVDLSLSNIRNQGQRSDIQFNVFGFPVSMKALNRTWANVGVGKEWYFAPPADPRDPRLRIGFDAGGRLGTGRADFNGLPSETVINGALVALPTHRTDTLAGAFVAVHADFEKSCGGCCIFLVGFRVEWDYMWSDLLQVQNNSDMEDLNILLTAGVRF